MQGNDMQQMHYSELEKINPAMYYFRAGLNEFTGKYLNGISKYSSLESIETPLVYSIFLSAYQSEKDAHTKANQYLKADIDNRKVLIEEVRDLFLKMDPTWVKVKDKANKLTDEQIMQLAKDDRHRLVIGLWAINLLEISYKKAEKGWGELSKLFFYELEKTVRDSKFHGLKIRKVPHFSKGTF